MARNAQIRYYSFGCITCERAAIIAVRADTDYVRQFHRLSRTREYPNWVDRSGFTSCDGDSFFPITCRTCEFRRSSAFNILDGESQLHPNPYISKRFLLDWDLLEQLREEIDGQPWKHAADLGAGNEERPILRSGLLHWLQGSFGATLWRHYRCKRNRLEQIDWSNSQPFFQSQGAQR